MVIALKTKRVETFVTVVAVALVAVLMAVLIWERASWDDINVSFGHTLYWQLLVWSPWIAIIPSIWAARYRPWFIHLLLGSVLIALHYLWFRGVSSDISPFVGHADTRYGVFAYFFLFWTLIDLTFYAIVLAVFRVRQAQQQPATASAVASAPCSPEGWSVMKNGDRHWVKADTIHWVEAQGYYARLHTDAGDYLLRESLTDLHEALKRRGFVRVHRSTLVRVNHIEQLSRHKRGYWQVRLSDGVVRRVSREGRKQLREKMSG
ncbi:MAG: hypothetical protein DHS20C11_05370 [Lysobacteraceae bacterium]|nr:MAG: hypothetical protein DHS20C11_05370 [Xanthomonadaceae bacterium]